MSYSSEVLADSPVRYWRMGDASSPITDETGGGNLTVTGGTFSQPGLVAKSVSFDGTDDTASATINLSAAAVITFEAIVYWSGYADDDDILAEFNGPYFSNDGSFIIDPNSSAEADTISIGWRGGGTVSRWTIPRSAMSAGNFHHLVVVMNRTLDSIAVYVDGAAVTTTSRGTGATGTFANATLSLMSRGGASLFGAGRLSEVAIYTTGLSSGDVAAHFAAALPEIARMQPYRSTGGLGGAATADLIPETANALFATVGNAQRVTGLTDYRCFYVKNTGQSPATDVRIWVQAASSGSDVAEAIGEDTSNPAQTTATTSTAPTGVTFSTPANYAGGLTLGDIDVGDTVPVWVRRVVTAAAAGQTASFTLGVDWDDVATGDTGTEIDISYVVVESATIYVDADSGSASNAYTRAQATNPGTPFLSPQSAAMVALPGDIIRLEPSTLGNADPANLLDPDVYPPIHHLQAVDGSDIIPYADNSANETITVSGHIDDGLRPKMLGANFKGLKNWAFEDFQQGYDQGSADAQLTNGNLHACADLNFTNILYTGGGYYCIGCTGTIHWDQCETNSRYVSSGGFLAGNGFRVLSVDTDDGISREVTYRFTECLFEDIEGEDAIQTSLTVSAGKLEVIGCTFRDITQAETPGAPHTDCIQSLGGKRHLIVGSRFINCSSPFIASDGENLENIIIGNLVDGPGNGFHGQGTRRWVVAHNTIRTPGISVAIGDRYNTVFDPDFEQQITVVNNVAADIDIAAGVVLHADSVDSNNAYYRMPGRSTALGDNVTGLPEFGPSDRLASAGLDGAYELANTPVDSPGIGDGLVIDGTVIPSEYLTYVSGDLLGRSFTSPPDVGALQSDPGSPVTPAARAPYVYNLAPSGDGAALDADFTADLFPKPGETIDPDTVNTTNCYVQDVTGTQIPVVVTVAAPDDNGVQHLTMDVKSSLSPVTDGTLYPLVLYFGNLADVADTEGSEIVPVTWQTRGVGPVGPAIGGPASGPAAFTSVAATGRTTNGCVVTFNSAALSLTPVGMKQLQGFFDRLTMDTAGDEANNSSARLTIGPLE